MENDIFWKNYWNSSAKNKDIKIISGWSNRTLQEIIYKTTYIAKKLKLKKNDRLLDIGCGAGLLEILFTYWVKEIYAIDYSDEMVKIAKRITNHYNNIIIQQSDIRKLHFEDRFFNKIIVNSVIQYLNDMDEVEISLKELKRVIKNNGIILLSMNPDLKQKKKYFNGYQKLEFSEKQIKEKVNINNKIIWFNKSELKNMCNKIGFKSYILNKSKYQPLNHFDLLLMNV